MRNKTTESIERNFHKIDSNYDNAYVMWEHDRLGEDEVIVVNYVNGTYCYTDESLQYTINNRDEFTWYQLVD